MAKNKDQESARQGRIKSIGLGRSSPTRDDEVAGGPPMGVTNLFRFQLVGVEEESVRDGVGEIEVSMTNGRASWRWNGSGTAPAVVEYTLTHAIKSINEGFSLSLSDGRELVLDSHVSADDLGAALSKVIRIGSGYQFGLIPISAASGNPAGIEKGELVPNGA